MQQQPPHNDPTRVIIPLSEYAQRLTPSPTNGKTKIKRLPASAVKALFKRFSGIWGTEWDRRIEGHEKAAVKEWAEALADFKATQIETAIELARIKKPWPLRIAEFAELCHNANDGVLIKLADAIELSEKKLRKRFTPRSAADIELERDLLLQLRSKIYYTQNDKADVMFCGNSDCRNHIFVDIGSEQPWFCVEHRSN